MVPWKKLWRYTENYRTLIYYGKNYGTMVLYIVYYSFFLLGQLKLKIQELKNTVDSTGKFKHERIFFIRYICK